MGKRLGSLRIGGCTLTWERGQATLTDASGLREISLRLSGGGLGAEVGAKDPDQAILVGGTRAVLADGGAFTLSEVDHGKGILRAMVAGDRAGLVSREKAAVLEFGTGVVLGEAHTPYGASRPEMAVATARAVAVPFQDSFAVLSTDDGVSAVHRVKAGFPLLEKVGEGFLAGGGSLLVYASGREPGRADSEETRGRIREGLARVRGDLAAVPTRDDVYIVDGKAGEIRACAVDGRIEEVVVGADTVTVHSGGNRTTVFDRYGN